MKKVPRLNPRSVRTRVGAIAPVRWLVSTLSVVLVLITATFVGTNLITAIPPGASPITVTFNYNGATGGNTLASATVTPGASADSVLPFPTKSGLDFSGWFNPQSLLNGQRITTIGEGDAGQLQAGYVPPELAQTLNLVLPPAPTCAAGGPCVVGNTGPGGGTVFYVDTSRPVGSQYWEVGSDMGTAGWGCFGIDILGTWTAIGTGAANTTRINAGCVTAGIAARIASAPAGGYSDWFLPSKDELNQLCKYARTQSTAVVDQAVRCNNTGTLRAGFVSGNYWSSSQNGANHAWHQNLDDGYQNGGDSKNDPLRVRPVRAF